MSAGAPAVGDIVLVPINDGFSTIKPAIIITVAGSRVKIEIFGADYLEPTVRQGWFAVSSTSAGAVNLTSVYYPGT